MKLNLQNNRYTEIQILESMDLQNYGSLGFNQAHHSLLTTWTERFNYQTIKNNKMLNLIKLIRKICAVKKKSVSLHRLYLE